MAINYDALALTAQRLLDDNGTDATIHRIISTNYDPLTGDDDATTQVVPVRTVMVKLRAGSDDYDIQALPGGYEIGRARKAFVSGLDLPAGFTPDVGDRFQVGSGAIWHVRGNTPIEPIDEPLVHVLVLTR